MKRFAPFFILAGAGLLAAASAYASPAVPIVKDQALPHARANLLKDGWKARKFQRVVSSDAMDTFRAAGYTETEQCAKDEYFCVLDYVNAHGACLRVIVDYSTLAPLKGWVSSWTFECPNPELLKPAS